MQIVYTASGSDVVISRNLDSLDSTGQVSISRTAGVYTYAGDVTGQDWKGSLHVTGDDVDGHYKDTDKQFDITFTGGVINAGAQSPIGTLSIAGPLSMTDANIAITWNNTQIGGIKVTSQNGTIAYIFALKLDNVPVADFVHFFVKGVCTVETGTYSVDRPTDTIDLDTLMPTLMPTTPSPRHTHRYYTPTTEPTPAVDTTTSPATTGDTSTSSADTHTPSSTDTTPSTDTGE